MEKYAVGGASATVASASVRPKGQESSTVHAASATTGFVQRIMDSFAMVRTVIIAFTRVMVGKQEIMYIFAFVYCIVLLVLCRNIRSFICDVVRLHVGLTCCSLEVFFSEGSVMDLTDFFTVNYIRGGWQIDSPADVSDLFRPDPRRAGTRFYDTLKFIFYQKLSNYRNNIFQIWIGFDLQENQTGAVFNSSN